MVRRAFLLSLAVVAALAAAPPQRIVSTAPSITEMLYALGLGDRVAGVTNYCHYPPEAKLKPKIGDYTSPNLEAIAALKPDLVILQTNPVRLADRLRALRLTPLEINQDNIAALYNSIRVVGAATGADAQAAKLVDGIQGKLAQIRAQAASLKRTRAMFVIGRSPNRLDGLVVVGKATYLNEIIETAGGDNVFRDAPSPYPSVSLEEVLARNPEVIVDMGDMADTVNVTAAHQREVVDLWQRMGSLAAVKQHRVFAVASDIFVVPGPRIVNAAEAFFDMLHPAPAKPGRQMSFRAASLGFEYGLSDVSFELPDRGLIAIAGPNGAGKSTLLGVLAGLRAPYRGACSYKGVEVSAWKRREFARSVAFLPQSVKIEFPFTVEEVVMMGRTPYARGWLETSQDRAAVQQALEVTDATGFVGRDFRTLSGGERQRVILASALAQEPETLLLDEPTTFLDLKHQLSMYRLLAKLGEKLLVVTVTHDLNLALQFSSRILILHDGRLAGDGETAQVLSADNIERVFGVHARVYPGNPPHLTYEA